MPIRHVIYLHGFTSGPNSTKARFFAARMACHGVVMLVPDLNQPAFETLTITRMIDQTREAIDAAGDDRVVLIGASLGAFVALHAADERVDRLVLMAPALDFGGNRLRQLGEHGIDEWRRTGRVTLFHYGRNEPADIGFQLYEDGARYDAFSVNLTQPILMFQGTRDELVDPAMVQEWASRRPNVDLRLLDDGHQLIESVDLIWSETEKFLGLSDVLQR